MIGVTRNIKQKAGRFRKNVLKKIKDLIWKNKDQDWNNLNDNWEG